MNYRKRVSEKKEKRKKGSVEEYMRGSGKVVYCYIKTRRWLPQARHALIGSKPEVSRAPSTAFPHVQFGLFEQVFASDKLPSAI
jgi:hypothetical protein